MLDIILVNYNSTDHLLRCLESIYESLQQLPARVFVQDNASSDNVDRVTSMFPQVLLAKSSQNMGFAKAVNAALPLGTAPYIVLLNPDTSVENDFFSTVIRFLNENPDVGVVGPKIRDQDGAVQGSARSFPSPFTGLFGRSSFLTRWLPQNRFSSKNVLTIRSDGKSPMEVDWVSGACMVIRRKAIDEVGPMDERFFLYWEDADWCKRMWNFGWKVVYYPQASIKHLVGGSSHRTPFRSTVEFHRSAYRLFAKHAEGAQRLAKPVTMLALALRLLLSLSWYALYHRSGRSRGHLQLKNSPPPDA